MLNTKQPDRSAEQWVKNFDVFFEFHGLPFLTPDITKTTRTFFRVTQEFTDAVFAQCEKDNEIVIFGSHLFRRWDMVGNHGSTAQWGVRTCVHRYSPQLIWHSSGLVECDVDLYNPDAGGYYAIMHGIHDVSLKRAGDPWKARLGILRNWPDMVIPCLTPYPTR